LQQFALLGEDKEPHTKAASLLLLMQPAGLEKHDVKLEKEVSFFLFVIREGDEPQALNGWHSVKLLGGGVKMSIITDEKGNVFVDFQRMTEKEFERSDLDAPLTHSLVVVKCQDKFLMMFNKWRKSWELPGGVIEPGESPKDCALRELFEETNQKINHIEFIGLMKFHLQPSFHGPERTEYGALFYAELSELASFAENDEAAEITLWDGTSDIGAIQVIDKKFLN